MRKWLFYIGVIVALVAGYDYLFTRSSTTSVTTTTITTPTPAPSTGSTGDMFNPWILGLLVLAIVALVAWNRRALFGAPVAGAAVSISLPKAGPMFMEILTSVLVFVLVLIALYGVSPNAALFTTPEGWTTLGIYVFAMIVGAMVAKFLKKGAWLAGVIGLFIFFSLTGFHSWMLLNSDGVFEQRTHVAAWFSSLRGNGSTGSAQVASVGACSVSGQIPLDAGQVYDLNPQNCDIKLAYPNQCLALRRADWTGDSSWYRVCDTPGINTAAPNNIRYAYSTAPVTMFVQRRPH